MVFSQERPNSVTFGDPQRDPWKIPDSGSRVWDRPQTYQNALTGLSLWSFPRGHKLPTTLHLSTHPSLLPTLVHHLPS